MNWIKSVYIANSSWFLLLPPGLGRDELSYIRPEAAFTGSPPGSFWCRTMYQCLPTTFNWGVELPPNQHWELATQRLTTKTSVNETAPNLSSKLRFGWNNYLCYYFLWNLCYHVYFMLCISRCAVKLMSKKMFQSGWQLLTAGCLALSVHPFRKHLIVWHIVFWRFSHLQLRLN